jgi:hypothetical protein
MACALLSRHLPHVAEEDLPLSWYLSLALPQGKHSTSAHLRRIDAFCVCPCPLSPEVPARQHPDCMCLVESRGLGWRIHESEEDTKLSTNKQHSPHIQMKSLDRKMLTIKEFKQTRAIQIMDAQMSPSTQSEASTPKTSSHSSSPVNQQYAATSNEEARRDVSQPGEEGDESNVRRLSLSLTMEMPQHMHAGQDLQDLAMIASLAESALMVALVAPRHVIEATLPAPRLGCVMARNEARKPVKLAVVAGEVTGAIVASLSSSLSHQSDDELIAMLAGCASRSAAFAAPEPTSKAEHQVCVCECVCAMSACVRPRA